jgi:ParB-like chromosome segregation protein Spo0J
MEIVNKKVADLIPYAGNPRKNAHAVSKVAEIINTFGFRVPILVKSDNTIIDGHLRLKAALKLKLDTVPVVIVDDMSDAQIKAFRLSVNKMAEFAEWDNELLKIEFEELKALDFDLDLTGFDDFGADKELLEDDYVVDYVDNKNNSVNNNNEDKSIKIPLYIQISKESNNRFKNIKKQLNLNDSDAFEYLLTFFLE